MSLFEPTSEIQVVRLSMAKIAGQDLVGSSIVPIVEKSDYCLEQMNLLILMVIIVWAETLALEFFSSFVCFFT